MAQAPDTSQTSASTPDYAGLVQFLMSPFLDHPEALRTNCEFSTTGHRVWIRVAFEEDDRGRAFGRGGRNVQAVRKVLEGIAQSVGQSVHLEVYGGQPHEDDREGSHRRSERPSRGNSSSSSRPRSRRSGSHG